MSMIYLHNFAAFSFKSVLFFVSKLGIIKIRFPYIKTDISFYITKSHIKIIALKINEINLNVIQEISSKINKILNKSNTIFINKITLFGIGFRSWTYKVEGGFKHLILKIGFSRDLSIKIPFSVKVIILKPTLLLFKSFDKNKLNQFVAFLRSLKIPDSYKGKGLRYIEEKLVLKLGKT
jgi:large subunit ribosomal protein L6